MAPRERSRAEVGVVSSYLLRLLRESIPRTQTAFAEDVGRDLGTVQSWESGRRPLAKHRPTASTNRSGAPSRCWRSGCQTSLRRHWKRICPRPLR
ncbi:helix-turn-helix domain-containing protein [Kitasatospora sp. NPDC059088]|uniref:helix-turn-helix domain-containing protein n=1 Tax=Kitasatospora sp. NPDC059088 TaxID=3346722 RepID=UPI0036B138C6